MTKRVISRNLQRFIQAPLVVLAMLVMLPSFSWGYVDEYAGRERVLMLGDSITTQVNSGVTPTARAIGWQVQEAFAGLANVHLIPENFQDTDYALSEVSSGVSHIESWINYETWDVINFNTGLHDMKVGEIQHDIPSSYAVKLGLVVDEIDAAKLSDNWGESVLGGAMEGDFDGDGMVGPCDASVLAAHWGYGTTETNPIPEPSSFVMLGFLLMPFSLMIRKFSRNKRASLMCT